MIKGRWENYCTEHGLEHLTADGDLVAGEEACWVFLEEEVSQEKWSSIVHQLHSTAGLRQEWESFLEKEGLRMHDTRRHESVVLVKFVLSVLERHEGEAMERRLEDVITRLDSKRKRPSKSADDIRR